ncbi:hypothetical protein I7G55_10860 [Sinorhizobium meliloti]|uniref:hypothetical protein n=1 Tax=Rhizobium meliloti TaxID=382 RepID=UPI0002F2ABCD|nr:hypothetical protein [Sinorhizobium meliloti]MDE3874607.1 hypothetical protein [Sinorhizobium meliloti]
MNRRAFFGFAVGGAAAATAALLGPPAPVKAEAATLKVTVDVSEMGDFIMRAVNQAKVETIRQIRRDHVTRA